MVSISKLKLKTHVLGLIFDTNTTTPVNTNVIQQGEKLIVDSYVDVDNNTRKCGSGRMGLRELLNRSTEVVVVGLAMDYCVGYTSLHSLELGYPTTLLRDMTRTMQDKARDIMDYVQMSGGKVTTWNTWKTELDDWERAKEVAEFLILKSGLEERNNMAIFAVILFMILTYFMLLLIIKRS